LIDSTPRIIIGTFDFTGHGYHQPVALDGAGTYVVPADKRTQLIYLRAGNTTDALVTLVLLRNGTPMRLFPLGARSGHHVPLAVVEDLFPETRLELRVAAPEGLSGTVVLDMGLVEI